MLIKYDTVGFIGLKQLLRVRFKNKMTVLPFSTDIIVDRDEENEKVEERQGKREGVSMRRD